MRLICPNCATQYEVDDSAVPAAGREVQCGNCSSTWFQAPARSNVSYSGEPAAPMPWQEELEEALPQEVPAEMESGLEEFETPPIADVVSEPDLGDLIDESGLAPPAPEVPATADAAQTELEAPAQISAERAATPAADPQVAIEDDLGTAPEAGSLEDVSPPGATPDVISDIAPDALEDAAEEPSYEFEASRDVYEEPVAAAGESADPAPQEESSEGPLPEAAPAPSDPSPFAALDAEVTPEPAEPEATEPQDVIERQDLAPALEETGDSDLPPAPTPKTYLEFSDAPAAEPEPAFDAADEGTPEAPVEEPVAFTPPEDAPEPSQLTPAPQPNRPAPETANPAPSPAALAAAVPAAGLAANTLSETRADVAATVARLDVPDRSSEMPDQDAFRDEISARIEAAIQEHETRAAQSSAQADARAAQDLERTKAEAQAAIEAAESAALASLADAAQEPQTHAGLVSEEDVTAAVAKISKEGELAERLAQAQQNAEAEPVAFPPSLEADEELISETPADPITQASEALSEPSPPAPPAAQVEPAAPVAEAPPSQTAANFAPPEPVPANGPNEPEIKPVEEAQLETAPPQTPAPEQVPLPPETPEPVRGDLSEPIRDSAAAERAGDALETADYLSAIPDLPEDAITEAAVAVAPAPEPAPQEVPEQTPEPEDLLAAAEVVPEVVPDAASEAPEAPAAEPAQVVQTPPDEESVSDLVARIAAETSSAPQSPDAEHQETFSEAPAPVMDPQPTAEPPQPVETAAAVPAPVEDVSVDPAPADAFDGSLADPVSQALPELAPEALPQETAEVPSAPEPELARAPEPAPEPEPEPASEPEPTLEPEPATEPSAAALDMPEAQQAVAHEVEADIPDVQTPEAAPAPEAPTDLQRDVQTQIEEAVSAALQEAETESVAEETAQSLEIAEPEPQPAVSSTPLEPQGEPEVAPADVPEAEAVSMEAEPESPVHPRVVPDEMIKAVEHDAAADQTESLAAKLKARVAEAAKAREESGAGTAAAAAVLGASAAGIASAAPQSQTAFPKRETEDLASSLRPKPVEGRPLKPRLRPPATPEPEKNRFGQGFAIAVAIFLLAFLVYMFSAQLATALPFLEPVIMGYSGAIDSVRLSFQDVVGRVLGTSVASGS